MRKALLSLLAIGLLFGVSSIQKTITSDRDRLGLTLVQPLENAPPVLAFTTVALGGFRGLISNALWIRANDLQDNDKFFEMAQLADWITKLEPHYTQVWVVQAWNMAYNISVKFSEFPDRWRWVDRGIRLLRDEGLRYNPNDILIYAELSWFFQHKMGANLDDANMYYKRQWLGEMQKVFGKTTPNLDELVHPQTLEQSNRVSVLRNEFKMDPNLMKEVDERYGPLEWRLPEAHAIYWAYLGLKAAETNPTKVKKDDLINVYRRIYQSMQLAFQRGRLIVNPYLVEGKPAFEFGPNLDIIPQTSAAYERAAKEDAEMRDHIFKAHRNFLRDAVYFLYGHNRVADASHWFNYLGTKYPDKMLINGDTNSFPGHITLDQYAFARIQEDVGEANSDDRVKAAVEGLVKQSYVALALGQDQRAAGFKLMANLLITTFKSNVGERIIALPMPSVEEVQKNVLKELLDPEKGPPYEFRSALRYKLGMPGEPPPSSSTNAPPERASSSSSSFSSSKSPGKS
ncbi:MAG: hypothetical protein C5B50_10960 [Verrucomicrobia bacterium]|nr:MAG: hypothetical protein C5B50_10960 [Verrucomicrobiota bacterium]